MSIEHGTSARQGSARVGNWIVVLFFFSGAAGLMYEVLWNRMLALEMGNTAHSLAAILTVFMGGLALGSWIGGRYAARISNGMRVYGLLEIGIGLYCLALPYLIDKLHPLMAWVYREHYGSFTLFNLLQFALCGLVLLVPVTAMGATLPIVAEHVTRRRERVSSSVGTVYAVNTFGAFGGCVLAGLWLVPEFGLTLTNWVAVGLNLAVGLSAVGLARATAPTPHLAREPISAQESAAASAQAGIPTRLILVGFGLSGFAAMAYQIAWTRGITLSIGSATYAFTLIVGAFILGLALGSAILGRLGEDERRTRPLLIGCQFALAVFAALILPVFDDLPAWVAEKLFVHRDSFARLQWAEFTMIFLLVLGPTFVMGGTLPLVVKEIVRKAPSDVGAVLGRAYASNTLGTILGAFGAGFVLIPTIGMRGSILVGVTANAVVGAMWFVASRRTRDAKSYAYATGMAAVPIALVLAMPKWDTMLMTSAPYIDGHIAIEIWQQQRATKTGLPDPATLDLPHDALRARDDYRAYIEDRYEILQHTEDVATTVTIAYDRITNAPELRVGGKVDARAFDSAQAFLAHLPLLLHPDPKNALIIGLGSGGTLKSALMHASLESVQDVEISGAVVEASRLWFERGPVFDDPRVDIIVGDGRLHVAMTDRRYDVIVSQPSNPWIVGASALFTQDCFEEMKAALAPDGIVCVWMQGFQVGPEPVRTLIATFASVFEHMDLWESMSREEYFLTGYLEPLEIDVLRVAQRLQQPTLKEELGQLQMIDSVDALAHWVGDREILLPLIEGTEVSTDDHNLLEARIPRGMLLGSPVDMAMMLMELRRPLTERVTVHLDQEQVDAFEEKALRIFESKPIGLEIFRSLREEGVLREDLLPRMYELNPRDNFSIYYLQQQQLKQQQQDGD